MAWWQWALVVLLADFVFGLLMGRFISAGRGDPKPQSRPRVYDIEQGRQRRVATHRPVW